MMQGKDLIITDENGGDLKLQLQINQSNGMIRG
jgi:hypothetical protein